MDLIACVHWILNNAHVYSNYILTRYGVNQIAMGRGCIHFVMGPAVSCIFEDLTVKAYAKPCNVVCLMVFTFVNESLNLSVSVKGFQS